VSQRKSTAAGAGEARKKVKTEGERKIKKARSATTKKTPKKSRTNGILSSEANVPSSEIRRSGRGQASKSYVEVSSDEESADDVEEEGDEEEEDEQQSAAGAELSSPEPEEAEAGMEGAEVEEAEGNEEEEVPPLPTHSSPTKTRGRTKSTPVKVATPRKAATSKRTAVLASKQVNGSAKKTSPKATRGKPATPVVPSRAAKVATKVNANVKPKAGTSRSSRASRRGKPPVDEFDVPESD
jgi:hypothetical protein